MTMQLSIDIGNSNINFGISEGKKLIRQWRIHTVADKTADEYGVIFHSLFSNDNIKINNIDKVVLCSVVPSLTSPIQTMVKKLVGKRPLILGPDLYPELEIDVVNPYEIGSDLVADAVAAYTKYHQNCIIVDFGTALSFVIVSGTGKLLGAAIAPGLKTAMNSLSRNTAQLPNVQLKVPPSAIGKNTVHAMQSGVIFGFTGLIEYLIDKIQKEIKGKTQVIATGGLSSFIVPLTKRFTVIEPSLTLDGLIIIGEQIL